MKPFIASIIVLLLAACGGGGGDGAPPRVVAFYGDSITSGTHSSSQQAWTPVTWSPTPVQHMAQLAGVQAIDYSYDGASSADASIRVDGAALAVIRFGVADTVYNMPPQVFAGHITRLVGQARAQGQSVLLTGLPHAAAVDTGPLDKVLQERAQALGVPFVDVRALPFSVRPSDLADPLHPGEAYSRRIGAAIAAHLR